MKSIFLLGLMVLSSAYAHAEDYNCGFVNELRQKTSALEAALATGQTTGAAFTQYDRWFRNNQAGGAIDAHDSAAVRFNDGMLEAPVAITLDQLGTGEVDASLAAAILRDAIAEMNNVCARD